MSDTQSIDAAVPSTTMTSTRRPLVGGGSNIGDGFLHYGTIAMVLVTLTIIGGVFWVVVHESLPTVQTFGWKFLSNDAFDPNNNTYGVAPAIFGTLFTSAFALIFAVPIGVGVAIFLVEVSPRRLRAPLAFMVDLLSALPSVVLGLWGFLVLAPWLQKIGEPWLKLHFGFLPFFQGVPRGLGLLAAGMILTIMVLPLVIAVAREVMLIVPNEQREALLALGATRWEVVRYALLPFAQIGIIGGAILGLGRALGETMAVTMVIGNQVNKPSLELFNTAYTLSSVIANQFNEATPGLFRAAVIEAGLVLLIITLITNLLARLLIARIGHRAGAV